MSKGMQDGTLVRPAAAQVHPNLRPDDWLSAMVGRPAYNWIASGQARPATGPVSAIMGSGRIFVAAKVPVRDAGLVHHLQANLNFVLVDTNVVLEREVGAGHVGPRGPEVHRARAEDEEQVVELARRSFSYSRFHRDARIPTDVANRIKAEWARNYFRGQRGECMLVALHNQLIVGFLQLLVREPVLTIDLIAVDARQRRQGIADGLISFAMADTYGCTLMRVGTQLANIPSVRLYEKLGFRASSANYVLHYHGPESEEDVDAGRSD